MCAAVRISNGLQLAGCAARGHKQRWLCPCQRHLLPPPNTLTPPSTCFPQSAEPWWQLRELLDEAWFVHCDVEEAMQRVYQRQTGHGVAPEVSRWRVEANDRPNAEQVAGTARHASLVVPTLPLQAACTTS